MSSVTTVQTPDGEFITKDSDKISVSEASELKSDLLERYYDFYNKLDERTLTDNELKTLANSVNNFKLELEIELHKRGL